MVEFRLSISPDDAPDMLHCLTDAAMSIDPSSTMRVETLRSAELVRIFFAAAFSAEQFLMRLGELGIEPEAWSLIANDFTPGEAELPF